MDENNNETTLIYVARDPITPEGPLPPLEGQSPYSSGKEKEHFMI